MSEDFNLKGVRRPLLAFFLGVGDQVHNPFAGGPVAYFTNWVFDLGSPSLGKDQKSDRSGMAEFSNVSVVHRRGPGSNLFIDKKYFLFCLCHI